MSLNWPAKGPYEVLDYTINWARALGTDSISTSDWTISAADLVEDNATNQAKTATIWLSGGTAGQSYTVFNTIVTAQGRTFTQTVAINVQNN